VWVADFVTPPLLDVHVAVWLWIVLPLFAPIVNVTRSVPDAILVATTAVGGAGEPTITGPDAADASPIPRAFFAVTLHV
jgi:hypothetical protein